MFRRKAYEKLLSWKEGSRGSRALLLEGARRTGKSTLARAFAENEYAGHLVIDFSEASEDIKDLFRMYRSDVDSFFMYLQAYTGARPAPPPRLPRRLRRGAALPPGARVHQAARRRRALRLSGDGVAHLDTQERGGHRDPLRGDPPSG